MTRKKRENKPEKPYKDFPLSAHNCGQWCKKIYGKLYYFGPWEDPDGALEEYTRRLPEITGQDDNSTTGTTVRQMCNQFLASKRQKLSRGKLTERTWKDYADAAKRLVRYLGPSRPIDTLRVADFDRVYSKLPSSWGATAVDNFVIRIRAILNYAYKTELIDKPIRTGEAFKRTSQKEKRIARAKAPKKFFDAADIRAMVAAANPHMKAMILCGVNLGFGNTDCSMLRKQDIDLQSRWYKVPRVKTGVLRIGYLWPETVEALQWVIDHPRNLCPAKLQDRVFVTRHGNEYCPDGGDNAITKAFAKVKAACNVGLSGVGFYALRHVTQTIGEQCGDALAVKVLMGHADTTISATYRENFDRERVKTVCDHLRNWYLENQK